MENISSMFNAGLCSSDAHCGYKCENETRHMAMSSLNVLHGTNSGQINWQCGLHAKFNVCATLDCFENNPSTTHDCLVHK